MTSARRLAADRTGAAAAEMALVLPILLILMFGSIELGNYFLSEHAVDKAVRDAARYAARLPMTDYPGCSVPSGGTAEQQTQHVARFGDPAGGGTARLRDWTSDGMTTLSISCDTSGTYTGMYNDFPMGVPKITVTISVPYTSLFGGFVLNPSLNLNASQEAAVIGA